MPIFSSTFPFQNSSCCLRCCPVIIWISKSKPPLFHNRHSKAVQGAFCSIWRARWRACQGTRGNLEHYSESTHHDIWSNYGRSNGNTNSSLKWILSAKWKGWSYSILGWHDVWTLKTSLVKTICNQNPAEDERAWGQDGINLLCFIGSALLFLLHRNQTQEKKRKTPLRSSYGCPAGLVPVYSPYVWVKCFIQAIFERDLSNAVATTSFGKF